VHAYMVFQLRLHLGHRRKELENWITFNPSKHMHPRISNSCRFAAWAHKVTHLRPGRRLCVPSECFLVFALRARGMSGQADSFLRRRTAFALEMTSPWSRQTQSLFRQPTALAMEILRTNPGSRPLTPWSTMSTTSLWWRPSLSFSDEGSRVKVSHCHEISSVGFVEEEVGSGDSHTSTSEAFVRSTRS
jgi:hypothetical protein